jgi:hypothetical protein
MRASGGRPRAPDGLPRPAPGLSSRWQGWSASAGGPETLLARAGGVSTLSTVRYWSTTDKKWRPLFLDATALAGRAEGGERRDDFRPSELQAGRSGCVAISMRYDVRDNLKA